MTDGLSVRRRFFELGNRLLDPILSNPRLVRLLGMQPVRVRYTGRRSGRTFELPAWAAVTPEGARITVGMSGRKTWWRNFRKGHPLELRVAGTWRRGTGQVHEPATGKVQVQVTWT